MQQPVVEADIKAEAETYSLGSSRRWCRSTRSRSCGPGCSAPGPRTAPRDWRCTGWSGSVCPTCSPGETKHSECFTWSHGSSHLEAHTICLYSLFHFFISFISSCLRFSGELDVLVGLNGRWFLVLAHQRIGATLEPELFFLWQWKQRPVPN